MSEDQPQAPPKPIVIGSAVITSQAATTASPASLNPEGRASSVWGGMSPELLDAFEQLEITLKSRPNNQSLTVLALFLTMGIPLLTVLFSDGDVFFSDMAGLCCITFVMGAIIGLSVSGHFTSWSNQRDRAQKSILVQAGLESAQGPSYLSPVALIALLAGGVLGGGEGFGIGVLLAVVLVAAQNVVNAAARAKDREAIQTLRATIEAMESGDKTQGMTPEEKTGR